MHNWLIFQYHRVRAKPKSCDVGAVLRDDPIERLAGSWRGTQEAR
jgi:hypothetical protein